MDTEKWNKDRRSALLNFCIAHFTYGMALIVYQPTEFFYFKNTMKVEYPDFYLGLSQGALYGGGLISAALGSVYYDKTSNVRNSFLLTNAINVLGNILYLLYYSPITVLVGQLLIGTVAARAVISVAELAKLYEADELTAKVGMCCASYSVGGAIGPILTYLFTLVDTHIGSWKLNVNNTVGVVMGGVYALCFLLAYFTLNDVSKECNFKKEVSEMSLENQSLLEEQESDENCDRSDNMEKDKPEEISKNKQCLSTIKVLFQDKIAAGLFIIAFIGDFSLMWQHLLIPIKSSLYLLWKPSDVATVFFATFVLGFMPTSFMILLLSKRIKDIDVLVYSVVASFLSLLWMVLFPFLSFRRSMIAFMYLANIFAGSSTYAAYLGGVAILAKRVPSDIQGVTEAFRYSCSLAALMIASLVIKLPSDHMTAALVPLMVLGFLEFCWLLANRKMFVDMTVMSF